MVSLVRVTKCLMIGCGGAPSFSAWFLPLYTVCLVGWYWLSSTRSFLSFGWLIAQRRCIVPVSNSVRLCRGNFPSCVVWRIIVRPYIWHGAQSLYSRWVLNVSSFASYTPPGELWSVLFPSVFWGARSGKGGELFSCLFLGVYAE